MPRIDEQDSTPPKDARISAQFDPAHPRLRPDTEDEQELREGETVLTFFMRPPSTDE
jgi:hypothetical protein